MNVGQQLNPYPDQAWTVELGATAAPLCECGSEAVTLADGTITCRRTLDRFEAMYGTSFRETVAP